MARITKDYDEYADEICKPFLMYAEYENGDSFYFHGWDEEDCMYSIAEIADDYDTECTYYTCVNDSCHYDGEYYKEDF